MTAELKNTYNSNLLLKKISFTRYSSFKLIIKKYIKILVINIIPPARGTGLK